MRQTVLLLSLCFLTASLISNQTRASDLEKEKRWQEQIVESLMVGEAVELTLTGKSEKILGLYTPATAKSKQGGAILLHGIGAHPNWPDVIYPLRTELPEHGWATLSIQMPILVNDAAPAKYIPLFDEVSARIEAAISFLKAKNINNIVLIGHSMGAAMGSYYLSITPKPAIQAFVGIGMGLSKDDPKMDTPTTLAKIKIPVLDLYGSQDLGSVLDSVERRGNAGSLAGNPYYQQLRIIGADHFFRNMDAELIKRVRGWLKHYASGVELPLK
ncbi:MAG: alpha/beta hydrolase family protein [Gammaproteobacteria bacterium]|nr:alpha/beta hydrolase family protein [Gammaproteobacteria bacterium]